MPEGRTSRAKILRQIAVARARDARERAMGRRAIAASYDRKTGRVMLELTGGFVFGFPAKAIPALADATPQQLAAVTLTPGGDVHWEALDADLSVPGLLLSSVGQSERFSELARPAGSSSSRAKAAARANGASSKISAICAMARRLVPLVLHVLQTAEPFDRARWEREHHRAAA